MKKSIRNENRTLQRYQKGDKHGRQKGNSVYNMYTQGNM